MSLKRYLNVYLLSLLSVMFSSIAVAEITEESFTVYNASSESNSEYLYLQAKEDFVLIASDIIIPISLGSETPSYQTLIGSIDSMEGQYFDPRLSASPLFADKFQLEHLMGDVTGDGVPELFIPDYGLFITGLAEEHGTTPQVLAQYSEIGGNQLTYFDPILNRLVLKPGVEFSLEDRNGDGRADLIITQPGKSPMVAEAGIDGLFSDTKVDPLTLSPELQNATIVTGAIAGSLGVDQGSASYVIPISAPIGTAGVQPKLTFTYADAGNNGLLGMGWAVSGLSQITRCSKDLYTDGKNSIEWYSKSVLDYDAEHHLCLDGERLVVVSGEYGADGAEYRTEEESFSRIIQHGVSDSAWFEVIQKSGDVIHYGQTYSNIITSAKIRLGAGHRTISWMMSRVEDAVGNYMAYEYESDMAVSGYPAISKIHYTGTSDFQPYNFIEFEYEDRPHKDWSEIYNPASQVHYLLKKRLKKVVSYAEDYVFRAYHLEYEQSVNTSASQLTNLYECNGYNECLEPTSFEWEDEEESYSLSYSKTEPYFRDSDVDLDGESTVQYADINGDGFVDLCGRDTSGVKCVLGTESGFDGQIVSTGICKVANSGSGAARGTIVSYDGSGTDYHMCDGFSSQYFLAGHINTAKFLDINGDGMSDLVWRSGEGIHFSISFGTEFRGAFDTGIAALGSADDGGNNEPLPGTSNNTPYIFYPDLNGDSLPEVCYRHDVHGMRCFWNISDQGTPGWDYENPLNTGICEDPEYAPESGCNSADNWDTMAFIDMNGDGMDDLFFRHDQHGIGYYYSTGDGLSDNFFYFSICENGEDSSCIKDEAYKSYQFPDINGDSLPDICWRETADGDLTCWANTGMFFDANDHGKLLSKSFSHAGPIYAFSDFNGDGRSDFYHLSSEILSNKAELKEGLSFYINTKSSGSGTNRYKLELENTTNVCRTGCNDALVLGSIAFIDTNGDGKQELVMRQSDGIHIYNLGIKPNNGVIKAFKNGFGLRTEVEYKPMTDPLVYEPSTEEPEYPIQNVTGPMPLVYKVETVMDQAANGSRWAPDATTYKYSGFKTHARGIGSLGFETITETKTSQLWLGFLTETVETTFNQDPYSHHKGQVVSSKSYINGQLQAQSFNKYMTLIFDANDNIVSNLDSIYETIDGIALPGYTYISYPEWSAIESFDPENGALLDAQVSYTEMGAYGNQITGTQWIQESAAIQTVGNEFVDITVDESIHHYKTHSTNEYAYDDPTRWYLGKLSLATVTKSGIDAYGETLASITRRSAWQYDHETGAVEWEKVLNSDDSVDTITYHQQATNYNGQSYPNYGVRNQVTTYEIENGQEVKPRQTKSFSDPKGRFTVLAVDTLGNEVRTSYHKVHGGKETVLSPNGFITTYEYDNWGRVVSQTNPDGTWSTTEIIGCGSGEMTCPVVNGGVPVTYYIKSTASGKGNSYAFMDLLGRQVKTTTQSYDGRFVSQTKEYDALNNLVRQSQPYFEGDTPKYVLTQFDGFGRPEYIIHPGANGLTRVVSEDSGLVQKLAYEGRNVIYYNYFLKSDGTQSTQFKKEYVDVGGIKYQTQDELNNFVEFRFDAYGNKLSTKGRYAIEGGASHGNEYEVTMNYDEMGRKTSMSDPSKGDWEYTYSKRGELVLQKDANDIGICHVYDSAGRLIRRYDNYTGDETAALDNCSGGIYISAEWIYDTAPRVGGGTWKGKLHQLMGENGYKETYYYDQLGRTNNVVVEIDGNAYTTTTVYDELGRVTDSYYPSSNMANRLKVSNVYNALGFLTEIQDHDGVPYWQLGEMDAKGNVTNESFGNDVIRTTKRFDANNGTIQSIESSRFGGAVGGLQEDTYQFNGIGNLNYREMTNAANDYHLKETFGYDNINRLTSTTFNDLSLSGASASESIYTYYSNGNIKNKAGVGEYTYGDGTQSCTVDGQTYTPSSHAVMHVTGQKNASYCYDKVGNLLEGDGRTVAWTPFNKPWRITRGNNTVDITYGPTRSRYKRVDNKDGEITRYTYVGAYEKIERHTGALEEKFSIGGFAVVTVKDQQFDTLGKHDVEYLLKDHLGSNVGVVNIAKYDEATSTINFDVQRMAYDPWGKRRNFLDWTDLDFEADSIVAFAQTTNRGFTGHEMMDPVGLIHMNGRVYDAELGRFLSADPFIQSPDNSQSLNRYSYVMNNPVSYTDPSGFFFKSALKRLKKAWKRIKRRIKKLRNKLKKLWRKIRDLHIKAFDEAMHYNKKAFKKTGEVLAKNPVLGSVVTVAGCAVFPLACPLITAGIASAQSYAVTGSWNAAFKAGAKAAAIAYLQGGGPGTDWGGVYGYIGKTYEGAALVGAHALAGGAFSVMGGGDFKDGALSAGFSKMVAVGGGYDFGGEGTGDIAARTGVAAIVGGTTSKLTGGKFASGAMTAAFAHLMNAEKTKADIRSKVKELMANKRLSYDSGPFKTIGGINYGLNKLAAALVKHGDPALIEIFKGMTVDYDEAVYIPKPDAGAVAFYDSQNITFYGSMAGSSRDVFKWTMFHEFRHLQTKNHQMRTSRDIILDDKAPFELDAEKWASDMINK